MRTLEARRENWGDKPSQPKEPTNKERYELNRNIILNIKNKKKIKRNSEGTSARKAAERSKMRRGLRGSQTKRKPTEERKYK